MSYLKRLPSGLREDVSEYAKRSGKHLNHAVNGLRHVKNHLDCSRVYPALKEVLLDGRIESVSISDIIVYGNKSVFWYMSLFHERRTMLSQLIMHGMYGWFYDYVKRFGITNPKYVIPELLLVASHVGEHEMVRSLITLATNSPD